MNSSATFKKCSSSSVTQESYLIVDGPVPRFRVNFVVFRFQATVSLLKSKKHKIALGCFLISRSVFSLHFRVYLTLIMTIWDSSKISRKEGFSTHKLMLDTMETQKPQFMPKTIIMLIGLRCSNLHLWLMWDLTYIWDWCDLQCSTGSLEFPLSMDYRWPLPGPSPFKNVRHLYFEKTTNENGLINNEHDVLYR